MIAHGRSVEEIAPRARLRLARLPVARRRLRGRRRHARDALRRLLHRRVPARRHGRRPRQVRLRGARAPARARVTTAELAARRLATHQSFYSLFPHRAPVGASSPSVVPASPDRSLFNAVTYIGPQAGGAAAAAPRGRLRARGRAGVDGVGAAGGRGARGRAARSAGHVLDGTPEAMGARLADARPRRPRRLAAAVVGGRGGTNAAAYGVAADGLDGDGAGRPTACGCTGPRRGRWCSRSTTTTATRA